MGLPDLAHLQISPKELHNVLKSPPAGLRLIDCREPDEHAYCAIHPPAVKEGEEVSHSLIPLADIPETFQEQRWIGERESPIVIYCHHGMRSDQAALHLREKGFPRVWSLAGGIEEWALDIEPDLPRY